MWSLDVQCPVDAPCRRGDGTGAGLEGRVTSRLIGARGAGRNVQDVLSGGKEADGSRGRGCRYMLSWFLTSRDGRPLSVFAGWLAADILALEIGGNIIAGGLRWGNQGTAVASGQRARLLRFGWLPPRDRFTPTVRVNRSQWSQVRR